MAEFNDDIILNENAAVIAAGIGAYFKHNKFKIISIKEIKKSDSFKEETAVNQRHISFRSPWRPKKS